MAKYHNAVWTHDYLAMASTTFREKATNRRKPSDTEVKECMIQKKFHMPLTQDRSIEQTPMH